MIEHLAKWVVRRPVAWMIVLTTLALSVVFMSLAARVPHDDDLLAFLPKDNEAVGTFYAVNKRFGGLDTALVGFETDDIFRPGFLKPLRRVTDRLDEMPDIRVLSLMNLEDFSPDPMGGIKAGLLVPSIPQNQGAQAELRRDVLARDHVVGNIVSENGKAALLIATLSDGADPRDVAARIRGVVEQEMPTVKAFYGGTPFVSSYIYDTTQEDMRRLTPWAVLAIVLIMLLAFRDLIGTGLALLSTGIGIILAIGTMDLVGASFNIVLGGMPVILFAVGSAYGIHILARYYSHVRTHESEAALTLTLVQTGPTVIAAGLTTVAGLLSFLCMDIEPLRTFGVFTALGIFATLVLSLTFIPAVISLTRLKARPAGTSVWQSLLERSVASVARHRKPVLVVLGLVTACGLYYTGKVDSSMDPKAFYEVDSTPDQAERFLGRYFGGSQFAQLHIEGDMKDPHLLRALQGLVDTLSMFPEIHGTAHIGQVIARANEGFEDAARIPDTKGKVATIYGFLEGQAAIRQLISDDRKEALVQLKIASRDPHVLHDVLERIEAQVAEEFGGRWSYVEVPTTQGARAGEAKSRRLELVVRRVRHILKEGDIGGERLSSERLMTILAGLSSSARPALVEDALVQYLKSEESVVDLPQVQGQGDPARKLAKAVAMLGPSPDAARLLRTVADIFEKPSTDEWVDDLAFSLETRIAETWRDAQAEARVVTTLDELGIQLPENEASKRVRKSLASGMMALDSRAVALRAPADAVDARTVAVQVTGLPVLHRGLSQSVTQNQFKSLAFALILVFMIMMGVYRSVWSGLLATAPTALTLLIIYGAMGLFGVQLDIGTSMLASLIIGAGVDYGVHLLDAWHVDTDETLVDGAMHAAAHTGPAIWTNALAVCAGFFVLTLGDARPLQNVGGLTAAAMLTAAIATFVVIPALARKRGYVSRRVVELTENPHGAMDAAMSTALRSAAPRLGGDSS